MRGAVALAIGQAVGFEVERDDFGGAALLQCEVEPQAGRTLADDGDGLAAQVGQHARGVEYRAELLRLHRMLQRRGRVQRQQAVDRRQVILAHGAVVGRQTEHAVARLYRAVLRINRLDHAHHFMPGFAGGGGVAVVRQVVQVADIAAAERQAQRTHQRGPGLQRRNGRVDKGGLPASDNLHGFHQRISPFGAGALADSIAVSPPAVDD